MLMRYTEGCQISFCYSVSRAIMLWNLYLSRLGELLAQLVECRTFDCKVSGSNFTRGAVLCPRARHYILIA